MGVLIYMDSVLQVLLHLLALLFDLPLLRGGGVSAYRDGGSVVVCIYGLPRDVEIYAVDLSGYYVPPSAARLYGSAAVRGDRVYVPRRSQAALVLEVLGEVGEVRLQTDGGGLRAKVSGSGSCPAVDGSAAVAVAGPLA